MTPPLRKWAPYGQGRAPAPSFEVVGGDGEVEDSKSGTISNGANSDTESIDDDSDDANVLFTTVEDPEN